jgi:hypothetical protein
MTTLNRSSQVSISPEYTNLIKPKFAAEAPATASFIGLGRFGQFALHLHSPESDKNRSRITTVTKRILHKEGMQQDDKLIFNTLPGRDSGIVRVFQVFHLRD